MVDLNVPGSPETGGVASLSWAEGKQLARLTGTASCDTGVGS